MPVSPCLASSPPRLPSSHATPHLPPPSSPLPAQAVLAGLLFLCSTAAGRKLFEDEAALVLLHEAVFGLVFANEIEARLHPNIDPDQTLGRHLVRLRLRLGLRLGLGLGHRVGRLRLRPTLLLSTLGLSSGLARGVCSRRQPTAASLLAPCAGAATGAAEPIQAGSPPCRRRIPL